jgi:hypothetical protein
VTRTPSTGIALSGGGIRAASFGLGAVQELQDRLGLLRGEKSADWISAVSGGSYIAGTITLLNAGSRAAYVDGSNAGGTDLPAGTSPVTEPTIRYLLSHSRYMVEQGGWVLLLRILAMLLASFVTLGVMVAWVGTMLIGDLGLIGWGLRAAVGIDPEWLRGSGAQWAVGLGGLAWLFVAIWLINRSAREPDVTPRQRIWVGPRDLLLVLRNLLLVPVLLVPPLFAMPSLIERLDAVPLLSSAAWTIENLPFVAIVLGVVLGATIGLNALAVPLRALRPIAGGISYLVARALAVATGVILVSWAGLAMFRAMQSSYRGTAAPSGSWLAIAAFMGVIVGGVLVSPLPGLVSPHRPYRTLIARGFVVRRGTDGRVTAMPRPDEIALSSLRPAKDRPRYPELLICASANLTDVGSTPAGANVLPLVIGGETVSIPTELAAVLQTADLEAMRAPSRGFGLVKPRPMLSLTGAIAIAGAAVSPAMGRMTLPSLRPLLTTLNIRLGVWLPNPLSEAARAAATERKSGTFFVGIDQLIWELFGLHSAKFPLVYSSDGGHYENLGIIELLRRRCSTIWAVDSSVDRQGQCRALAQAIRLAHSELDCRVDLDLDVFAERDAAGLPTTTWSSGSVRYTDGSEGVIHVIRLGLTAQHSTALKRYASGDRAFPHHSTLAQVFRWEAFRLLPPARTGVDAEAAGLPRRPGRRAARLTRRRAPASQLRLRARLDLFEERPHSGFGGPAENLEVLRAAVIPRQGASRVLVGDEEAAADSAR